MASSTSYDDSNSLDSVDINSDGSDWTEQSEFDKSDENYFSCDYRSNVNFVSKLISRQIHGRFTNHPRSKTEPFFRDIYYNCRFKLDHIIPKGVLNHIFMGFSLCGKFFFSYSGAPSDSETTGPMNLFPTVEYEVFIWSFVPGQKLKLISKHRIFKLFKSVGELRKVSFMQFPSDPCKLICYGTGSQTPEMAFLTILTLPFPKNCRNCKENLLLGRDCPSYVTEGWCLKHGFILHYMFSLAHPSPPFDPNISLAYPDHIVINTGHYVHILNVSTYKPSQRTVMSFNSEKFEESKMTPHTNLCSNFPDTLSDLSESPSELFSNHSIVDMILEDFSEYDLEGNDCNKPFHELNISCEPLNVTGKSYALIQNIVDPRLKLLQNSSKDYPFPMPQTSGIQKSTEKPKIDKKIAEKAYEFIEENEKFEKISLFRKKRLADKKYEFSEDNSENIVPFYSLRRERRYFYRSQGGRSIRSPDFTSNVFLSPRSSGGLRSPMQSPNSRSGQFSPGGARNLYCPIIRNSPHHSKSPISPKESARKFNVYSPSLDSDCSDFDSKLILRPGNNTLYLHSDPMNKSHNGLLIIDSKINVDKPRWIKKVVRRYSSVDFENSSLVSGQSRDDYNIPIEIPLLVQTLTEQHLDVVPEFKSDQITETQLIVTQRTFDCEQFVQGRAQKLCIDAQLEFSHCEDYDVKIVHICPLNGHIVCKALIKIGAIQTSESCGKPRLYLSNCLFSWNISSDSFEIIESVEHSRLQPSTKKINMPKLVIPNIVHKKVHIMDHLNTSKCSLRDYNNCFEICMDNKLFFVDCNWMSDEEYSIASDNDYY